MKKTTEKKMDKASNEETLKTVRKDLYQVDPRNIVVEEGFNSRFDFDLGELKESIRNNGVKNPISVIAFKDADGSEKYRLVDGERRYRSVMELIAEGVDIARVPCLFLSKSLTKEELLMEQLTRNEGKKFNEYEYGVALRKFVDMGYEPSEVIKKLGLAPWKVIYLTHLDRDERVQKLMREGRINGVDVRHIYQAHKGDEQGAVDEILRAAAKTEGTEEKITVSNLDRQSSKTIAVKDTQAIKKGLKLLMQYYVRWMQATGDTEYELSIEDIYTALKQDKAKTINDIFEEGMENRLVAE